MLPLTTHTFTVTRLPETGLVDPWAADLAETAGAAGTVASGVGGVLTALSGTSGFDGAANRSTVKWKLHLNLVDGSGAPITVKAEDFLVDGANGERYRIEWVRYRPDPVFPSGGGLDHLEGHVVRVVGEG
jgi:hypothetical protein